MHNLKNKIITGDKMSYLISFANTVKPLNTGHSWSLKCLVFGGVRHLEVSVRRGFTALKFLEFHNSIFA